MNSVNIIGISINQKAKMSKLRAAKIICFAVFLILLSLVSRQWCICVMVRTVIAVD